MLVLNSMLSNIGNKRKNGTERGIQLVNIQEGKISIWMRHNILGPGEELSVSIYRSRAARYINKAFGT